MIKPEAVYQKMVEHQREIMRQIEHHLTEEKKKLALLSSLKLDILWAIEEVQKETSGVSTPSEETPGVRLTEQKILKAIAGMEDTFTPKSLAATIEADRGIKVHLESLKATLGVMDKSGKIHRLTKGSRWVESTYEKAEI